MSIITCPKALYNMACYTNTRHELNVIFGYEGPNKTDDIYLNWLVGYIPAKDIMTFVRKLCGREGRFSKICTDIATLTSESFDEGTKELKWFRAIIKEEDPEKITGMVYQGEMIMLHSNGWGCYKSFAVAAIINAVTLIHDEDFNTVRLASMLTCVIHSAYDPKDCAAKIDNILMKHV